MLIVQCPRCGKSCQEATALCPDARPLKRSTLTRGGMCAECAVSALLRSSAFPAFPPESLLLPHIQSQLAAVFQAGNADIPADGINWSRVIEIWDLPFPKKSRARHYE